MKIVSLIHDPDVIRQILKHLGLWKQDVGSRCKKPKPERRPLIYEEFDEGWSPYEESELTLLFSQVSIGHVSAKYT
jgi:hypothetical protein